jgi:hypothetical protein
VQEVLTGHRGAALGLALAALALASPTRALDLGEIEVLSTLGQNFDARIPVKARNDEWFHATCLALSPTVAGGGLPGIAAGSLSVERRRGSSNLRVRTTTAVNDPAIAFGVTSTCAGAALPLGSGFTVLLDPPGTPRPASRRDSSARRVPAGPTRPAIAAPPRATRTAAASPSAPVSAPAPEPKAAASPRRAGSEFVLKLTNSPIDLARTRQFDDKSRALLRERLRLLDSDDQVAEMLTMRDNLRRLEARVSELQLKLAAAPASLATATPATRPEPKPPTGAAEPAGPAPATTVAPKVEAAAPKVEAAAPKEATPPAEPAPTKVEAAAPKAEAAAPKAEAAAPPAQPRTEPGPAPIVPAKAEAVIDALDSLSGRVIAAAIALVVLLVMLAGWLWTRWRQPAAAAEADVDDGEATMLMEPESAPGTSALAQEQPIEIAPATAPVMAASARPEIASDAALATRLEENTEQLRRRYIEERFPEIRSGAIVLDDPASVVKGARLFYEDGAIPRAVELLSFAIEDRPGQFRPWLALFEIYRLERLSGEYADLAGRFAQRHGATEQWPKVRAFGREIDPSNPLYQEAPMQSLETIGPREARRMAAADPMTENWLEAPMDFENEVLATELRRSLMARAAVEERDLAPNPMPALRSVEMFPVG